MKKLIFPAIFLILTTLFYFATGGIYSNYSKGFRSGEIQKASYKGIFLKSFEGELVQTGFKNKSGQTNPGFTNTWAFSSLDPEVSKKLESLAGRNVTVYYKQWWIAPWRQDTSYTVYRVEEVK